MDILEAVEAREFNVWTEDLWETADALVDRAVETRLGIFVDAFAVLYQFVVLILVSPYGGRRAGDCYL